MKSFMALIKKAEANPESYQQPILDNLVKEIFATSCEHNKIITDHDCKECDEINKILSYNWCGF